MHLDDTVIITKVFLQNKNYFSSVYKIRNTNQQASVYQLLALTIELKILCIMIAL